MEREHQTSQETFPIPETEASLSPEINQEQDRQQTLLDIIAAAERLGHFENGSLDQPLMTKIRELVIQTRNLSRAEQITQIQAALGELDQINRTEVPAAISDELRPIDRHCLADILAQPNQLNTLLNPADQRLQTLRNDGHRMNDFRNSVRELAGQYIYSKHHPMGQAPKPIQKKIQAMQAELQQASDAAHLETLQHYLRDQDITNVNQLSAIETATLFYRYYDLHQYDQVRDVFRSSHNPLLRHLPEVRTQYVKALVHTQDYQAALEEIKHLIRDGYLTSDLCVELGKIFRQQLRASEQAIRTAHDSSQTTTPEKAAVWQDKKITAIQELNQWRRILLDVLETGFAFTHDPVVGIALVTELIDQARREPDQRRAGLDRAQGIAELVEITSRKNAIEWSGDFRLLVKYAASLCFLDADHAVEKFTQLTERLTALLTPANYRNRLKYALEKNFEPLQKILTHFNEQEFPELEQPKKRLKEIIETLRHNKAQRAAGKHPPPSPRSQEPTPSSGWLELDPISPEHSRRQRVTDRIFQLGFMYGELETHIEGNYKYDGNHHAHTINQWDIGVAREILRHPALGLNDEADFAEFNRVIDQFIRNRFGTASLEDMKSAAHHQFDTFMEKLNQQLAVTKDDDGRTNIMVDFFLGRGDCRQHAYTKQLFFEVWKTEKMTRLFDRATAELDRRDDPHLHDNDRKQAQQSYHDAVSQLSQLANQYLLIFDSEIRAPIAIDATYDAVKINGQLQATSRAEHQQRMLQQHAEGDELRKQIKQLTDELQMADADQRQAIQSQIKDLQTKVAKGRYSMSELAWPPVVENHTWNGFVELDQTGLVKKFKMVDSFYQDVYRFSEVDINPNELDHHLPIFNPAGTEYVSEGNGSFLAVSDNFYIVTDAQGKPIDNGFYAGELLAMNARGELTPVPIIITPASYAGSREQRREKNNDMMGQPWLRGYLLPHVPKLPSGTPDVTPFFDPMATTTLRTWTVNLANLPLPKASWVQSDHAELDIEPVAT